MLNLVGKLPILLMHRNKPDLRPTALQLQNHIIQLKVKMSKHLFKQMFKVIHQTDRKWTVASLDKFYGKICISFSFTTGKH